MSLILAGALAACGADGEPWTPTMSTTIGMGSGGVYTSGNVGVHKGPVSINVGRGCGRNGCW